MKAALDWVIANHAAYVDRSGGDVNYTRSMNEAEVPTTADIIFLCESRDGDSHMDWPINAVRWRSWARFQAPGYGSIANSYNPSMDGVGCNGSQKRIPRHLQGLVFLFADGHAKWLRQDTAWGNRLLFVAAK